MKVKFSEEREIHEPKSILKKTDKHKKDVIPDYSNLIKDKDEDKKQIKKDANYHNHYIKPCQLIGVVGPSGSGKSNFVVDFINRKNNSFYEIIYFNASTSDEPLLRLLKKHIEGIQIIDDIEQLPKLEDYNDSDKSLEKLLIWDDVINLPKKKLIEIQKWFNSGRKYGFTICFLAQNYTDIPIQIRRNVMIWVLFRLHDNNTISNILKNHSTGEDKSKITNAYFKSTENKGQFFIVDFNASPEHKYRSNFLNFITI